jgi:hypothetical protein
VSLESLRAAVRDGCHRLRGRVADVDAVPVGGRRPVGRGAAFGGALKLLHDLVE